MTLKQMCAVMLVPVTTTWFGTGSVRAQSPSPQAQKFSAIPLENSSGLVVTPTPQGLNYRSAGGNAALRQLRNPFGGGKASLPCPPAASGVPAQPVRPLPSAQTAGSHFHRGRAA